VFVPLIAVVFGAEAGAGAALNGQPLRVSAVDRLDRALLNTGFPYDIRTTAQNNFAEFERFHRRAQAVRRGGSAALDCAWVAAGRADGYWEFGVKPWDVAAGGLLVREAGGRVTTVGGSEDFLGEGSIIASNGRIHDDMFALLAEVQREREVHG
jgi:myo-inositol-1(or 4)-monophosphatase